MAQWLIDTNVLIDHLRGHDPATRWLEGLREPGLVSAVTYVELFAGARDASVERELETLLRPWRVVRVDAAIGRRAGAFVRLYGGSHGVDTPDALIAACAEAEGARLATRNVKHFPMLSDVEAPY